MNALEITLFWATVFCYAAGFCFHLFGFMYDREKGMRYALGIFWGAMILHTFTGIARWAAAGHPPVTDTYELNLTGTWFTMLVFLCFEKIRKVDRSIGLVVIPVVFLVLGHGMISRGSAIPMGTAHQSPWLVIHVVFAWLAFGCFVVATGAAVLFLIKDRFPAWQPMERVPGIEALDVSGYRFIVLGFINHAVMLVSGAIWAKMLWGTYWSWDPLETWSLLTFLFYAFYLHARAFLRWRLKRSAWLTVIGFIILVISFWGVDWFKPATVRPGHEWNESRLEDGHLIFDSGERVVVSVQTDQAQT